MKFSVFQISRKGGRDKNEDRMGYCYTRDTLLLVVCDGMGGHLNGEIAAQICVRLFIERFQREAKPILKNPFKFLQEVRSETAKVTWPTRRETTITTIMVFVMVALASIFFFAADQIIRYLVTTILMMH